MSEPWVATVPTLNRFAQVTDPACYTPLPDDWMVGVSDVVNSTKAIEQGQYKAVNLAGAGTIAAVLNALGGDLPLFTFAGDGARFAVSPGQSPAAADALARAAMWARRDLGLELRVGLIGVSELRAAGHDARVAFWRASDHVRYAMFTGGGLGWADEQLKSGAIGIAPAREDEDPDLTGLSCQWGPVVPSRGKIVSLIVKRAPGALEDRFASIASQVVEVLEDAECLNPVPPEGPSVRWPTEAMDLQSRIASGGASLWWRRLRVFAETVMIWLVFKLGVRVGRFEPDRYRREIAINTDFRKFDDALMMTVDCSTDVAARLRAMLKEAADKGAIRYGLHEQDEALVTCVVPSAREPGHMHFVDGAGGGYASAARQLRAAA